MTSEKPIVVVGIDPGKTTGMFVYSPQGRLGGFHASGLKPFYAWQEIDADDAPLILRNEVVDLVDRYGVDGVHIAVERYVITGRTAKLSQQTDALEVTGMMRAFAKLYTRHEIHQYMKANLKFANDAALKRAGWYSAKLGHATDAARQAYALLKDVDYPAWLDVSNGAMMKFDDEMKG